MSPAIANSARLSLGALAVLALAGCCRHQTPATSPKASHEESAAVLADMTVALVQRDKADKPSPHCAGVWVSDSAILTAAHCVEGSPVLEIFAQATGAKSYWALVAAVEPVYDLALLQLLGNGPAHRVAKPALAPARPGAFVQTMGHPIGLWWSYSSGNVAAIRVMPDNALWVQATVPINGGNSGGGLFNEDNELVGVTYAMVDTPSGRQAQGVSLFSHGSYVKTFLREQGL